MYSKDKNINIQPAPKEYSTLDSAYNSIRQQYHPSFVCQVVNTIYATTKTWKPKKDIYYIDVLEKGNGNWVGYLGEPDE